MIKWSYNGIILPVLPDSYDSCVMFHNEGVYYAIFSDGGFGDINGTTVFLASSNVNSYMAIPEGVSWVSNTISYDPTGATFISVGKTKELVWSSHHIIDIANSTTNNYVYAYSGSNPVEVIAADMPVADFGWYGVGDSGVKIVSSVKLSQGRPANGSIACFALAPDGGSLSVVWYKNNTLLKIDSADGPLILSTYEPSTDVIESYNLYCQVYNSYNNTLTAGVTHTIPVNVVEYVPMDDVCHSLILGWLMGERVASIRNSIINVKDELTN